MFVLCVNSFSDRGESEKVQLVSYELSPPLTLFGPTLFQNLPSYIEVEKHWGTSQLKQHRCIISCLLQYITLSCVWGLLVDGKKKNGLNGCKELNTHWVVGLNNVKN